MVRTMVRTGRLRTSDRRTRLLGRGAKQRGEQLPESFTALFTARDGGVPVGSAAGCGPFPTCYRSHKLLGRLRGHGRDLERRQFSPVKTEVISNRLKDSLFISYVHVYTEIRVHIWLGAFTGGRRAPQVRHFRVCRVSAPLMPPSGHLTVCYLPACTLWDL